MRISLKRLPGGKGLPLPSKATPGAAGYDLHAALPPELPLTLVPGDIALIPTGFAIALPDGWEAQVRPRSGLALNHGITTLNAPGTIDSDYRGEIGVILINHGREAFTIGRGARIAQMVIAPVPETVLVETDDLDATDRGDGGFGSTGGSSV